MIIAKYKLIIHKPKPNDWSIYLDKLCLKMDLIKNYLEDIKLGDLYIDLCKYYIEHQSIDSIEFYHNFIKSIDAIYYPRIVNIYVSHLIDDIKSPCPSKNAIMKFDGLIIVEIYHQKMLN